MDPNACILKGAQLKVFGPPGQLEKVEFIHVDPMLLHTSPYPLPECKSKQFRFPGQALPLMSDWTQCKPEKKLKISQSGQRSFNLIIRPIQLQLERSRGPKVRQGGIQALVAETAQPLIIVNRGRNLPILPLVPGRLEIILLALFKS